MNETNITAFLGCVVKLQALATVTLGWPFLIHQALAYETVGHGLMPAFAGLLGLASVAYNALFIRAYLDALRG